MPATPTFLFAPGAGAPSTHPWMQRWRTRLESLGPVTLLDYPYMLAGRKRPDPLPQSIEAHRAVLLEARKNAKAGPMILIGKSMGGRVGCHVANVEPEAVDALICLGYPLCAMGDRTKLRDKVLLELSTPILFIQGTRDPLCPLDLLQEVRKKMTAPNELHVVEGGDHSLMVRKRELVARGLSQDEVDDHVLARITQFFETSAAPSARTVE